MGLDFTRMEALKEQAEDLDEPLDEATTKALNIAHDAALDDHIERHKNLMFRKKLLEQGYICNKFTDFDSLYGENFDFIKDYDLSEFEKRDDWWYERIIKVTNFFMPWLLSTAFTSFRKVVKNEEELIYTSPFDGWKNLPIVQGKKSVKFGLRKTF